jgi:TM2 domain-containing membrane protein YozV
MHVRHQPSLGAHKMIPGRSVANGALLLGCWLAISTSSVAAAAIVANALIA